MSEVTTAFYTEGHRIEGQLLLSARLAEKLNDPLTDFIELRDAKVWSLNKNASTPAVNWPVATIPKKTIMMATLDVDKHESRQSRIDNLQSKRGSEVGAVVGSIEVYGTGHLQFTGAATRVFTTQLQPFFPITNATIVLNEVAEGDDEGIHTGLALVNREMVRAFTLS